MTKEKYFQHIIEHFNKDNYVKHIGAKLISVEKGMATASLIVSENHLNAHGVVQGGLVFSLADLALGAASASHGNVCLAVQANIQFLRPATLGMELTATAQELSHGKKVSNYLIQVKNNNGKLIASFTGVTYDKGITIK